MGDSTGHSSQKLKPLLMCKLLFSGPEFLQLFIQFSQIRILRLEAVHASPEYRQKCQQHDQKRSQKTGNYKDTDHSVADRKRDLVIVDHCAYDQEIIPQMRWLVGGYLPHSSRRVLRPPVGSVHQKINISIRPIHTKRQVNLSGSVTQQDIVLVRRGMRTHLYVHQILTQTVRSQELKTYL